MRLNALWPNKLLWRLLLTLLLVILLSQLAAGMFWYRQVYQVEQQGLSAAVEQLAQSAAATTAYYQNLPLHSRHLILEQNRALGANRFFISLNTKPLDVEPLSDSPRKQQLVAQALQQLQQRLGQQVEIRVEFTRHQQLRVYDAQVPITELPASFSRFSLALGDMDLPVLVMQIHLPTQDTQAIPEWFYLAAKLPSPYRSLQSSFWDSKQIVYTLLSSVLILLCTWLLLRRQLRPIRRLATAAQQMGSQMQAPILPEEGSDELQAATRAFNQMNRRLKAYLRDREMLFSAISHDLKTPLACLKLRCEMIDNPQLRDKFSKSLSELDLMVKAALQCLRDTQIHEDIEPIDLSALLDDLLEYYNRYAVLIDCQLPTLKPLPAKPLALKRLLTNVIDNAIKYGKSASIRAQPLGDMLAIRICDQGPGIAEALQEKVFEPYFRIDQEKREGTGLGLSIARSIARAHGGELSLHNRETGGLEVLILLPQDADLH